MAKHFQRKGRRILGIDLQSWIKGFFGGNAGISIVILFLICLFLIREAVLFFPQHHRDLEVLRKSGQEYVGYIIKESDEYTKLVGLTNQAYYQELDARYGAQRGIVGCFEALLDPIEDDGEDVIEALEEAREGDDPAALQKAEADWTAFAKSLAGKVDRTEIDSFGRLKENDEAWQGLLDSIVLYDPVEEEEPDFVKNAQKEIDTGMAKFSQARVEISEADQSLKALRNQLVKIASTIKDEVEADKTSVERKAAYEEGLTNAKTEEDRKRIQGELDKIVIRDSFPYAERTQPIADSQEAHVAATKELKEKFGSGVSKLPDDFKSPASAALIAQVRAAQPGFIKKLDESVEKASSWEWDKKVGFFGSTMKFFFGIDWVTNSSWHDFYGLLPLFTGSLLISLIALAVAVPFSIGAAIYVNRLATRHEQTFIKPAIEMIQAIPSVVLGFFGIMVLGEGLRTLSEWEMLSSWVPGFPMQERLNILNAGLLLALMAVPTIFTLCEDALNNVPRSYSEASLALGASKLQTVTKVIVPTAISGILAAVLLGFGRVIGETMVVLLVAGNKISLPDWGAGLGVVTQPTHTMTGIIAQEMGEVTEGTLHFRALFLVGLVLFTISLMINIAAQRIIKRLGRHA